MPVLNIRAWPSTIAKLTVSADRINFVAFMQPAIHVLPLTSLVDALRTVVLEGAGLGAVRMELMQLAVWALVPFGLALKIFKWR